MMDLNSMSPRTCGHGDMAEGVRLLLTCQVVIHRVCWYVVVVAACELFECCDERKGRREAGEWRRRADKASRVMIHMCVCVCVRASPTHRCRRWRLPALPARVNERHAVQQGEHAPHCRLGTAQVGEAHAGLGVGVGVCRAEGIRGTGRQTRAHRVTPTCARACVMSVQMAMKCKWRFISAPFSATP